jgi:hypothetical protein
LYNAEEDENIVLEQITKAREERFAQLVEVSQKRIRKTKLKQLQEEKLKVFNNFLRSI